MSEVWLTHPGLTPEHDQKVLRAAIGAWSGSGWQVREDQTDPVLEVPDEPDPPLQLEPPAEQSGPEPATPDDAPADDVAPVKNPTSKER